MKEISKGKNVIEKVYFTEEKWNDWEHYINERHINLGYKSV